MPPKFQTARGYWAFFAKSAPSRAARRKTFRNKEETRMGWTKIDRSQWKREAYFRHYYEDVPCFYSMTVHLDITRLHAAKLRLQPAMLYLLARVINRHEEFRIALVDAQPGVYDVLFPSYTVFHPQTETFSNLWTEYRADFADFLARYDEDVLLYGNSEGFMPKPNAPENLFTVSTLPWARFESFHLHLPRGNDYLLPIFTIGRFFKQEGKILLPLALQVHHSVCDGFHACRFVQEVQSLLDAAGTPGAWSEATP